MKWISHKYSYIPSLLKAPPPQPSRSSQHQAELPVLDSRSPLAVCFTHGNGYTSMLLSQFSSPSASPAVSTRPFSTSASLFLPCKQETVFCLKTGRLRQKQLYTNTTVQLGTWFLLVNAGYQRWNCVPCLLGWTSKSVAGGWLEPIFPLLEKVKVKVKSLSRVRPSATPWTAAFLAPPSMGFSRQEYWSGVPLPSPKGMSKKAREPSSNEASRAALELVTLLWTQLSPR